MGEWTELELYDLAARLNLSRVSSTPFRLLSREEYHANEIDAIRGMGEEKVGPLFQEGYEIKVGRFGDLGGMPFAEKQRFRDVEMVKEVFLEEYEDGDFESRMEQDKIGIIHKVFSPHYCREYDARTRRTKGKLELPRQYQFRCPHRCRNN